jgi:hypothetical protein
MNDEITNRWSHHYSLLPFRLFELQVQNGCPLEAQMVSSQVVCNP